MLVSAETPGRACGVIVSPYHVAMPRGRDAASECCKSTLLS